MTVAAQNVSGSKIARQLGGEDMTMKNPPHPGRIVRQECIEPLGLTVTDAAERLGVKRQTLSNLVNGKAGISPEMSIRLSKAFGSKPEVWLGMQMEYDLAQANNMPDCQSRWSQGKDLSWEPLRPELVVEVAYEHMQGARFRHLAHFRRWRTDKKPGDCTYAQLEVVPPQELMAIFGGAGG
jgi:addiction module HigA family antidote